MELEKELEELNKLDDTKLTGEQAKRSMQLQSDLNEANDAITNMLKALAAADGSVKKSVDDFVRDTTDAGLRIALKDLREDAVSGVAAIYTVLGKEIQPAEKKDPRKEKTKFGWAILVTERGSKAYPIDVANFNELVFQFRDALASDKYDPKPLAAKIYNAIFRQKAPGHTRTLEDDLSNYLRAYPKKTLMWSLDGVLRYIPMSALHDGESYLVEKYRNVVLTNKNIAVLNTAKKPNWRILGMGISEPRENFTPLPGVKAELESIVREPNSTTGILDGTIRINADFKKQGFFQAVGGGKYQVVHIASHYSFNPDRQGDSFLLLGDGRISFEEMNKAKGLFNAVDLLTLSACDTGTAGNGTETEGFAVQAQSLGARSVIASLWKVSDAGTPELMIRFYRLLADDPSMSKGEAFQRAQLSLLGIGAANKTRTARGANRAENMSTGGTAADLPLYDKTGKPAFAHPHYWASFVLIGNWR